MIQRTRRCQRRTDLPTAHLARGALWTPHYRGRVSTDPLAPLTALPGIAEAVEQARAGVDRLLGHKVLRRRSAEVTGEASLRSARASAALAGAPASLEDFRAGRFAAEIEPVAQGALRISAALGELTDIWERTPRQALARLHLLAARGLLPEEELGRPRPAGAVVVDEGLDLPPAPAPDVVAARLETLLSVLGSQQPALVVAAVVHGELLTLRPFTAGNGLVARGAARLVLIGRGFDPKAVTAPEVGHLELGAEAYAAALTGFGTGTPDGVAGWLRHVAEAAGLGAREGLAVAEAVQRADEPVAATPQ